MNGMAACFKQDDPWSLCLRSVTAENSVLLVVQLHGWISPVAKYSEASLYLVLAGDAVRQPPCVFHTQLAALHT